ncbi:MAG: ATP-binding cassette domain-containing protein [Lachnospiraceae bacterium]|nr:ATP-binding cassette domain-containing protein [Lachnospiraceae bacterium]
MLTIRNLTKKYKKVTALNNANLEIKEGHIYGIVGPNGAGKTTLFKMLAGLVRPTEGEILTTSEEPMKDFRNKVGFMIENPYLYENMTALQNMKIIGGIKGETDVSKLEALLKLVGLDSTGNKKVKQFSLGMKQRLGIACALTADPEVLVLDEPMNGVDPEGIVELRNILLSLNKDHNKTLLLSSHILSELELISTDFVFVKEGRIQKCVSRDEITGNLEEYYMKEIAGL